MVAIADVTGHGARAASLTAVARYTLRTAMALTGDPKRALAILNRALLERADGALCSVALLILDRPVTGTVSIAVAGHPPPLLVRGGAASTIRPDGPVLGAFDEASWEVVTVAVDPGDQFLLYTDGVVEARGREERFGEERLCQCLSEIRAPGDAIDRISAELDRFADGELEDDAAALAVMRSLPGDAATAAEDVRTAVSTR
jgi:sigma-B regulation protein RsbU (phosphoserine phosphatase)